MGPHRRGGDVPILIHWHRAPDYPPSQGAGCDSPISERSARPVGQRSFPITDGRAAGDAELPADAGGGFGVSELRVKGQDGIFRVFYYTASARGVMVFHAFGKKTQKTPPLEIELARKRLKELLDAQN